MTTVETAARRRLGVVLGGAVLTLAALIAGGAGNASASAPAPMATATAGPTAVPTCPPALPMSSWVSAVTTTSVTITYSILLRPPCGYDPPLTVTFYATPDDARLRQNPVAEAVSGPERSGTVTVGGLTPGTDYWFRFTADRPDPYLVGTARTSSTSACSATLTVDSHWSGGYTATVTVRNVGTEPLDGWQVSWRWSGDEQIPVMWNAVREVTGPDVTARNASWNAALAPGASTAFGMLVRPGTPDSGLTLTCGR